ncbi:MAG: DNA cytosine methyltransferase [Egibacteraceae bacterium]
MPNTAHYSRMVTEEPKSACGTAPGLPAGESLTVAGLFAGVGGIEVGLREAGHVTELLCEVWEPARAVLTDRLVGIPLERDVRELRSLPAVDVVSAGFPCTDLSQAGRTAGISGTNSGLVGEVFRLVRGSRPRWLLLENVRNMIPLDGGRAMRYLVDELEALRYQWAYRLVDSRFTGVPQRRHRVLFLASRTEDPRDVLLIDDAGERPEESYRSDAFGFYWTEGLRGLGWARDAVPPLKGGSTLGIPSPPAVWVPRAEAGRRLVTPSVTDAEQLQGFPPEWTAAACNGRGRGPRWKLVGNAVTVGVARWVGDRLARPGRYDSSKDRELARADRWPHAAWGRDGRRWAAHASLWPRHDSYRHIGDLMDLHAAEPLSRRAAAGFWERMNRSQLRFVEDFRLDVKEHVEITDGQTRLAV